MAYRGLVGNKGIYSLELLIFWGFPYSLLSTSKAQGCGSDEFLTPAPPRNSESGNTFSRLAEAER